MNSLAAVGARSLSHRKGRSLMTAAGIVLGVAILFGVLVTNASLDRAFGSIVDRFTEPWTDVQVRPVGANDATMPAELAQRAAALPDVVAVSPGLGYNVTLPEVGRAEPDDPAVQTMFLIGLDFPRWKAFRRGHVELAEGRLPASPDEMLIGPHAPRRWHATVGSQVTVASPTGERRLTVVGRLESRPNDGSETYYGYAGLGVVQGLLAHGDVIDGVTLDLRDGTDVGLWRAQHAKDLGPGVRLAATGSGLGGFRQFLTTVQSSLTFVAALALFVGAFLIYLTLSMAVVERTRLYGTLRALGATRRQVRRLVLTEAVALGGASTAAGLLLGLVMSVGLTRALSGLLRVARPAVVVRPGAVLVSLVAGVVVTVVSAFVPARRAARLAPVAAMRGDYGAEARLGRSWMAGVVFLGLGIVLLFALPGVGGMALATFAVLTGTVLLVPLVLRPLARLLGAATGRAEAGVGDIAVMHLVKERSRSAYTLALVMVVFAMVLSMVAANASMASAIDRTIDTQFGSDLRGWSPNGFAGDLTAAIRRHPEVRATGEVWAGAGEVTTVPKPSARGYSTRSDDSGLAMIDPATYFEVAGFPWTSGNDRDVKRALTAGGAVVLSANRASRLGVHRGDTVSIATQQGPRPFRVVALYAGVGDLQPAFVGIGDGRALFGADRPSFLTIKVADRARADAVRRDLAALPEAKKYGLFLDTAAETKARAQHQVTGFFRVFYSVLLVAAVVGLLGLTNTLAMSVLQRLREIGILRAVGTRRRQVRNMVMVEAATLVLVALVLAVPLGSGLSMMFVRSASAALGFTTPYVYPWAWVPAIGVLALAIGGLGAIAPARRASRLDVVAALAYE